MSDRSAGESEAEYIKREEIARMREAVESKRAQLAESEREELKQRHWMHCPKCGTGLEEIDHGEVKVDKCFSCGGIFLDDGELETLTKQPGLLGSLRRIFD